MQLDQVTKKHYDYLKRQFDMDAETFNVICDENGTRLDSLLDELTWKECDASDEFEEKGEYSEDSICAIELVDIICGPYDPDVINALDREMEIDE